jgi:lipopolysaccharide biosynthesis regulator YciM
LTHCAQQALKTVNDLGILLLLVVAIGIGWLLGRRSAARPAESAAAPIPADYYRGLNYLLDGRQDGAVDAFIDALEVNSETLETHIALGNLMRKRGEVERAIRVHQNLLARPSLPAEKVHQAHLELARDYVSAGLHDRAERLLLDLVQEAPELRATAHRHLLEIYQAERDWRRASDVALQLLPRKSLLAGGAPLPDDLEQVAVALAHYHCELAAQSMEAGRWSEAREQLADALKRDRHCARASLMLGDLELALEQPKRAIKSLLRVRNQNPEFVAEAVPALQRAYRALDDEKSLRTYYRQCLESHPSVALLLVIAEDLRDAEGEQSAADFLVRELDQRPSLRGLASLLDLQMSAAEEGPARDNLGRLLGLVERLVAQRPAYRCGHCGFSGRQLHWQCPGCKYWGAIKSIRDTDLEAAR